MMEGERENGRYSSVFFFTLWMMGYTVGGVPVKLSVRYNPLTGSWMSAKESCRNSRPCESDKGSSSPGWIEAVSVG